MKYSYLVILICLGCIFSACKPEFNLNAPYKDVPVVYAILNYQDSINYVKIYKGFQPVAEGSVFIDAQNPDSIYYKKDDILVVLEEYDENNKRTPRPNIKLDITHDFPRDTGFFYYKDERILYYTNEPLYQDKIYNIKITNKVNGNVVEGSTPIVGDFQIVNYISQFNMLNKTNGVSFKPASNASAMGYEFHVSFIYFEVDVNTKEVLKIGKITKNICSKLGEVFKPDPFYNECYKTYTVTFYDDIAAKVEPNPNVIRYMGTPNERGVCIEVEGWAAGESMVKFLLSNQPTSSFVQINTKYTNLSATEGFVFGFISSRTKCITRKYSATPESQDSLISGSKTYKLGFRPWIEYQP
ncbi:MAG: hypothetical protein FWF70_07260 [Bacteroidetes bacterium]|nr:hypothetical protein [Bacteroidota bacterium]MCL1968847.1 hypothetical protein [Bacteroidota bacterium]